MINLFLYFAIAGAAPVWTYAGAYHNLQACDNAAVNLKPQGVETYWLCINTRNGEVLPPIPR